MPGERAIWERKVREQRDRLATRLRALYPEPLTLTVELGCGNGHYLRSYAEAFPAEQCLGIDRMYGRVLRADEKQSRAGLANLRFLRADAETAFEVLPVRVRVNRVLVLFPDPWPKTRHHKHRLLQDPFLGRLAERVEPGCPLCFRTDHDEYFAWTRDQLERHPGWHIDPEAPWPHEAWTVFQDRAPSYQSLVARAVPAPTTPAR